MHFWHLEAAAIRIVDEAWRTGTRRTATGLGVGALLHLPEYFVEVEAGGLLALRVVPEGLQEFPDKGLRRHQHKDVIDKPVVVGYRRDVGALEGIGPEIEQLRHTKRNKGFRPDPHRTRLSLFGEHYLPSGLPEQNQNRNLTANSGISASKVILGDWIGCQRRGVRPRPAV